MKGFFNRIVGGKRVPAKIQPTFIAGGMKKEGFFDRILRGKRVFAGKDQPMYIVELNIGTQKYILDKYDLGFEQDVDSRHRPCSDVYGGTIHATTSDILSAEIHDWAISNVKTLDGELKFYENSEKMDQGAELVITFTSAYCTGISKELGSDGELRTTLTMSPAIIKLGYEAIELRRTK